MLHHAAGDPALSRTTSQAAAQKSQTTMSRSEQEHTRLIRWSEQLASEAERLLAQPDDIEAQRKHHAEVAEHRAATQRHLDGITARAQARAAMRLAQMDSGLPSVSMID
jgi:hypothetical protein